MCHPSLQQWEGQDLVEEDVEGEEAAVEVEVDIQAEGEE